MKFLSLLAILFFLNSSQPDNLSDNDFSIDNFQSILVVDKNSTTDVYETINCDFGSTGKHGIYRFIPLKNKTANKEIKIKIISITDNNEPIAYDINQNLNDNFFIKIGKPSVTYRSRYGSRTVSNLLYHSNRFKIHYQVIGAVQWRNHQPNLAWNVTGNQWPVAIKNIKVILDLPKNIKIQSVSLSSEIGINKLNHYKHIKSKDGNIIVTTPLILPGQDFKIIANLPANSLNYNSNLVLELAWFFDYWKLTITTVFLTVCTVYIQWYLLGRDKYKLKPIAVDFRPPNNLTPAESGIIYDESFDGQDLSATILDLAERGYLTIKKVPSNSIFINSDFDLVFTKTKPQNETLKPFEKILLDNIFLDNSSNETLSAMSMRHNKSYLSDIKDFLYNDLTEKKYFPANPEAIRKYYYKIASNIGIITAIYTIFIFVFRPAFYISVTILQNLPIIIAGATLSLIFFLIAPYMPRRSKKGVEALRELLSFKRYIEKAEIKQIKAFALENPQSFNRILPYAVALSLEKDWTKILNSFDITKPQWYEVDTSLSNANYNTLDFIADITILNVVSNQMVITAFSSEIIPGSFTNAISTPSGIDTNISIDGGSFGGGGGGAW